MTRVLLVVCLAACTKTTPKDTGSSGACGAVSTYDLTVTGKVVAQSGGAAVAGAAVELDDRGWNPGTVLGTATSGADGTFSLEAKSVTSVEKCWGTVLDYVLAADKGGQHGEENVNSELYSAIEDGSLQADVTGVPIKL